MKCALCVLAVASWVAVVCGEAEPEPEMDVTTASTGARRSGRASYLDQDAVETGMFILVAVCFVLTLAVIMLTFNYFGLKKSHKKLQNTLDASRHHNQI